MPKIMAQPSANEGRGRRGRRVSSTLAEINIIPLVDVMLVLLIIFMVAAPMLQRGVEVNLPVARQTQKMTEERIYITVPLSYRQDRRVYIDNEAVSIDFLAERTRQAMLGKDQREVFLRSDGEVQMQEVLQVFDRLKEGGIERVGIVAQQRLEPRGER
jgi:biopolymer transport protein TolR